MSKSTRLARPSQRPLARGLTSTEAAMELLEGEQGTWIVCGHHTPTGRRIVFLVGGNLTGDGALAVAKEKAAQLDPFTGPDAWQFSVEMYDVDAVVAMQCDDTITFDEPIPYTMATVPDLLDSDLQLLEQPPEDLFWPERAAELKP